MKLQHLLGLCTTILLLSVSLSHGDTYDWGTEGISDTTKADSVFQFTGDLANPYHDSLGGQSTPENTPLHLDSWDSQGEWIVYTSQIGASSNSNYELCKIKPDGSEFTRLTTNLFEDSNASFGSDGNIYFGRNVGTIKILRMKADGSGGETDLSAAHGATTNEHGPKVSPDASQYAYVADTAGTGYKLYVSQSDGTGTQQQVSETGVTIEYYAPYSFSWSPDSQWLTYVGHDGTGQWIYKVKADGSSHEALTKPDSIPPNFSYEHTWPTWSPDGTQIGYIERVELYVNPTYSYLYKLRVLDPEGNVLEDALDSVSYSTPYPDNYYDWNQMTGPITWSPDSKWLGYNKQFYDRAGVVVVNNYYHSIIVVNTTDNSEKYTLTSGYHDFSPLWSPDGSQILFADSYWQASRDDSDDFGVSENFDGDLLLLKLSDYFLPPPPEVPFPWPMFMPSIMGDTGQ